MNRLCRCLCKLRRCLYKHWEWTTLLFFIPFLLSVGLSQIFITREMAMEMVCRLQSGLDGNAEFAPHILEYLGLVGLYILVCAAVCIYFVIRICAVLHPKTTAMLPCTASTINLAFVCVTLAIIAPVVYVCNSSCLQISRITLSPIELYKHSTAVVCSTMNAGCFGGWISRGSLLALLPWLAGTVVGSWGALHAALVTKSAIVKKTKQIKLLAGC